MEIEGKKVRHIEYSELTAKQKERFNFQKAGGILADYGFAALKLDDDWNGADFLAHHVSGEITLKIQLKGRLTFGKKYLKKNIYVMFQNQSDWYLYPHDELLESVSKITNVKNTGSWIENGGYSMGTIPDKIAALVQPYRLSSKLE